MSKNYKKIIRSKFDLFDDINRELSECPNNRAYLLVDTEHRHLQLNIEKNYTSMREHLLKYTIFYTIHTAMNRAMTNTVG